MLASDPDQTRKPKSDVPCIGCGASMPACDGMKWLRGRRCCETCNGHHHPKEGA